MEYNNSYLGHVCVLFLVHILLLVCRSCLQETMQQENSYLQNISEGKANTTRNQPLPTTI